MRQTDQESQLDNSPADEVEGLYFFPDQAVTESQMRQTLHRGTEQERAWAVSHLLRYALWDDIWRYVSREDVREIFAELELPEKLRAAWGRMLKVEAPVA